MPLSDEVIAALVKTAWDAASTGNSSAAEAYHAAAELVATTFNPEGASA